MTEAALPLVIPPSKQEGARQRKLHDTGQGLLSDVHRRVRAGYRWWVTGDVTTDQVVGFVARMSVKYGTDADSVTRHRNKVGGEASTVLFVWPLRHDPAGYTTRFGYLLLSTEHLDGEIMYDGARRPVPVNLYANTNAVFHLMPSVEVVKVKQARSQQGKGKQSHGRPGANRTRTVYTWQLSAQSVNRMRSKFAEHAGTPRELERLRRAYLALPLVAPYRVQLKRVLTDTRLLRKNIHTPMARAEQKAIKDGTKLDPLRVSDIPFITGFPKLYASPPMTLGAYLDAITQTRRTLARNAEQTVQAHHLGERL
ncbi:hypothetical protein [Deinococcus sonorensis]|uniref:Uncharacterized protein n=2 Tax=Deinococcus sonorensis TaxID=309891 RepID=A0AAU7U5A6_9DEIO